MAEQTHVTESTPMRPLTAVLKEVEKAIQQERAILNGHSQTLTIKDLRWKFDQVSAKMNQAIYNDQQALVHDSALKTVAVLFEILARS